MSLIADNLLDRIKLKKSIFMWRTLAIIALVLILIIFALKDNGGLNVPGEYIARIPVEGIIFENPDHDKILKNIRANQNIKAVIVYVNSPGGTIVGGENLYTQLRQIAITKPVVVVMGSLAASGGYMAAIAGEKIFARSGTITGSIGVLMQSFDVTELGKKAGISFVNFKSGKLKATPSPFEKLEPEAASAINASIADSFNMFLNLVTERRSLSKEQIAKISDGRVFTGRQALDAGLIDAIGGEDEAIEWLQNEKKINKNLKVINVELDSEKKLVEKLMSKVTDNVLPFGTIKNGGLLAIWNP